MDVLARNQYPPLLTEIPDVPETLYYRGATPQPCTYLAVIGSRDCTEYGRRACRSLIEGIAQLPVGIVSGLALGIDTIAHQAALDANMYTIAIPGSGLADESLYPRRNKTLAHTILKRGGTLISEYPPAQKAARWTFPKRNRLMAGIAQATLVIEAGTASGTSITARLALEYNRDVLVVPGSIFSKNSVGVHHLLNDGAIPISTPGDLAAALGFPDTRADLELSKLEADVLVALATPCTKDELFKQTTQTASEYELLLAGLIEKGLVVERNGKLYRTYRFAKRSLF